MSKKYDVVFAGGGHNALTAACYLSKAGMKVCVVERLPHVGGGVWTGEMAAPGFKTDPSSVIHALIQSNPLLLNDELKLLSKYGLKYVYPDVQMAVHFYDGSYLNICKTLDQTVASIAQFSKKDAESYTKFVQWSQSFMDVLLTGLFNPPPPFGVFASMMDQSDEGRDILRMLMLSSLDVIEEWFENEKVKIALTRWVSEIMVNPRTKGTGMVVFLMLGMMHKYPPGMPIGGSGALTDALSRCLLDLGGEIKTSSPIKEFKLKKNSCEGVILDTGEEILASRAVVSTLHIKQVFPGMISGANLPQGFNEKVEKLRFSSFSCFHQGLALHEPPAFKAGPDVNKAFLVEFAPETMEDYLRYFDDLEYGIPHNNPLLCCQSLHDPSRAPAGKHTLYLYEYAPYHLKEGGSARWDEIRQQYAESVLDFLRKYTTNMGSENIIGQWIQSPVDLERHNISFMKGDFGHIGAFMEQNMGNRPLPGWNYKTPVEKLYMCGPSTHPGSGCSGGARAAVQAIMQDLGIDFEKVIGK